MTHRLDDAGYGDLAVRWCALAEQRLEYLTRLFESDRWRRYYSEVTFLQNIQEAKTAVETWRSLSAGGAIASAGSNNVQTSAPPVAPEPVPETAVAIEAATTLSDQASSVPEVDLPSLERALEEVEERVLDLAAIERRYPLLRNTL
jgi:uncharacterized repeat protein (TIGR03809 family)